MEPSEKLELVRLMDQMVVSRNDACVMTPDTDDGNACGACQGCGDYDRIWELAEMLTEDD